MLLHHVATFWELRGEPNLLFVHYADLKADLAGEMRRVASFLEIEPPTSLWPAVVERCTFDAMKARSDEIGAFQNFEGGAQSFLFKGTNGRWRDTLAAGSGGDLMDLDLEPAALQTVGELDIVAGGPDRRDAARPKRLVHGGDTALRVEIVVGIRVSASGPLSTSSKTRSKVGCVEPASRGPTSPSTTRTRGSSSGWFRRACRARCDSS